MRIYVTAFGQPVDGTPAEIIASPPADLFFVPGFLRRATKIRIAVELITASTHPRISGSLQAVHQSGGQLMLGLGISWIGRDIVQLVRVQPEVKELFFGA